MYNSFMDRLFHSNKSVERTVIYILSITIAIVASVIIFVKMDRVPATSENFEELRQKLLMLEENPEEFMKHKGNITIYDSEIVYETENDECKIKGKYTRDFKLISYIPTDKANSVFINIICCIALGIIFWVASSICVFGIIFIGESLVIGIIYMSKRSKKMAN